MKCLSLWQPWASLLVSGAKRVETRSWPIRHRGPQLIHAAKKWNDELRAITQQQPFASALEGLPLPFGAIVGRVEVVECYWTDSVSLLGRERLGVEPYETPSGIKALRISSDEWAFGDYTAGRYAFLCKNPVRFRKPIEFRGAQGLFDVPQDVLGEAFA